MSRAPFGLSMSEQELDMERLKSMLKKTLVLILMASMFLTVVPAGALAEAGMPVIHIAGSESSNLTLEEAKATEIYAALIEMFEARGVQLDITAVSSEQYLTYLQSCIASGKLPDFFDATSLSLQDRINLIERGKLMPIDDILAYSDGTAKESLSSDGYYSICRTKDTYEDGNLYYLGNVNLIPSVEVENFGLAQMNRNTFTMKIRQDWLDKVGLPMPTTLDEFFDAMVAFRENDVNGNGLADERIAVPVNTCTSGWGNFFDNGIAQWFGLTPYVFNLNYETGECEVPFLQDGFADYASFMKRCYEAGLIYLGDDIGKTSSSLTTALTQNVVGAYFYPANSDQASSGDPDENYVVMPIITGTEKAKPVMEGSRGYKSWGYFAFSADADPKAAAALLDVILSKEYAIWYIMGIEGATYEVRDGLYVYTGPNSLDEVRATGIGSGEYVIKGSALPSAQMQGWFSTYKGDDLLWDSFDAYLGSAYYQEVESAAYTESQRENMVKWCEIAKQLNMYNMNTDLEMIAPMATVEEAEVVSMYKDDLYTYMDELFANLITGKWSLDDYEEYKQELYDLGIMEMLEVYQAQYDRIVK